MASLRKTRSTSPDFETRSRSTEAPRRSRVTCARASMRPIRQPCRHGRKTHGRPRRAAVRQHRGSRSPVWCRLQASAPSRTERRVSALPCGNHPTSREVRRGRGLAQGDARTCLVSCEQTGRGDPRPRNGGQVRSPNRRGTRGASGSDDAKRRRWREFYDMWIGLLAAAPDLSNAEKLYAYRIHQMSRGSADFYESIHNSSVALGLNRTTVIRARKRLRGLGLVEVAPATVVGGRHRTRHMRPTVPERLRNRCPGTPVSDVDEVHRANEQVQGRSETGAPGRPERKEHNKEPWIGAVAAVRAPRGRNVSLVVGPLGAFRPDWGPIP